MPPSSPGFLRHVHHCTNHNAERFMPFCTGGQTPGWVRRELGPLLEGMEGFLFDGESLTLRPGPDDVATRTQVLTIAANFLSKHYGVPKVDEIYPVIQRWGDAPLAEIDRAAIPWFGVPGFGVHVNGYVRKADGLYVWIARRAKDRRIDPGKLDNMVGGGLPIGLTVEENVAKEAWEEAGLPADIAAKAQACGMLSYQIDMMKGLRNDTLFIFDLELPEDVIPANTDGEVESFTLMPAAEVAAIIEQTDDFKFNCNLVLIDFFLRHGVIGADHTEYAALKEALAPLRAPRK